MTFVIIYVGQILDGFLAKGKRERLTSQQKELYYRKLTEESLKMEEKKLNEELILAQEINSLQQESKELKSQLEDAGGLDKPSDWSADDYEDDDNDNGRFSDRESTSSSSRHKPTSSRDNKSFAEDDSVDEKVEQLNQEIAELQEKAKELESVEDDIRRLSKDLGECNVQEAGQQEPIDETTIKDLNEKIKQLESENEELKLQLKEHSGFTLSKRETDLEPELLKYLEDHQHDLTLGFLEKVYETLLEIKASEPDKDFDEYIEELKKNRREYVSELAELRVSKKEAEIKLQKMKRRYEEELSSFNEIRVEHIFKNSGAKEYLERLKEKNKIKNDIINTLKAELEAKESEVASWQTKYRDAEKQCNEYWEAWKDTQSRKEKLEAEKKAQFERERRAMNLTMNLSSASSLVDNQVPPPPPIDVPPVDEILRMVAPSGGQTTTNPYSMSNMNSSIPPPPPVDVPYNEIFRHARPTSGHY